MAGTRPARCRPLAVLACVVICVYALIFWDLITGSTERTDQVVQQQEQRKVDAPPTRGYIVIADSPSSFCAGNKTIMKHSLGEFDGATAFSACPLVDTTLIYSALGLDLGCVLNTGVRMYCCVGGSNSVVNGEFIMPAWVCYTAPRLNEEARIQWEDTNEFYWKDVDARWSEELGRRERILKSWVTAHHTLTGNSLGTTLLDVGSNQGWMLGAAGSQGFKAVVGLENNPKLAASSMQHFPAHRVYASLEQIEQLGLRFDVVTAFHVLEHLVQPFQFVAQIAALMDAGSVLFGEVPDACPKRRVVNGQLEEVEQCMQPWLHGGDIGGLVNLLHLQYWTHDSIRYLLEMSGFDVIHMEARNPSGPEGKVLYILDFMAIKR